MAEETKSPWNSLEKAKLAISAVTPVLVLVMGIAINNSLIEGERSTALRGEIYKTVGGDLNDIYCYLFFVGNWKDLSPSDVLAKKRALDRAMFTYRPFFSDELFSTYKQFMAEAFSTFGGSGKDARIRSAIETPDGDRRIHTTKGWEPSWEIDLPKSNEDAQREAYTQFYETDGT